MGLKNSIPCSAMASGRTNLPCDGCIIMKEKTHLSAPSKVREILFFRYWKPKKSVCFYCCLKYLPMKLI